MHRKKRTDVLEYLLPLRQTIKEKFAELEGPTRGLTVCLIFFPSGRRDWFEVGPIMEKPERLLAFPLNVCEPDDYYHNRAPSPYGHYPELRTARLEIPPLFNWDSFCLLDYCIGVGEGCPIYMIFAQKEVFYNTAHGRVATYVEGATILVSSRDVNAVTQKKKDFKQNQEEKDNVLANYTHGELTRRVELNDMNAVFGDSHMLPEDIIGLSDNASSSPALNSFPRRADESDNETVIACEEPGSLPDSEFLAALTKNRAEGEASIQGLTGNINTDRYALTINAKKGVVTATWKNRGEHRTPYKRAEERFNSIRQCKKMRASCISKIALQGVQGCFQRCELWRQWHSCWIYGELPTMNLKPSMFLPAHVPHGSLDSDVVRR